MFSYRSILKKGLKISWKHRYLWVFGLFASIINAGGEYQILNRLLNDGFNGNLFPGLKNIASTGIFSLKALGNILMLAKANPVSAVMTVIALVLIACIAWAIIWLAVSSQGALISENEKLLNAKKKSAPDFRAGLNAGGKSFWPIFWVNVLLKIVINLVFVIISLPVILMIINPVTFSLMYALAFIIFFPVALSLSLIAKYMIGYIIIEKEKFKPALQKSWKLFYNNWIISLEMALALFFINVLAGLAILLFITLIPFPLLLVALVMYKTTLVWLILLLIILFIITSGSFLAAFQFSAWTDLFLHLTGEGGRSKIERLFTRK